MKKHSLYMATILSDSEYGGTKLEVVLSKKKERIEELEDSNISSIVTAKYEGGTKPIEQLNERFWTLMDGTPERLFDRMIEQDGFIRTEV